jgi:hypothetical protein
MLLLPLPALAIPAITCHCFTDRVYEQARPAAADPYFLATTQNSLFALFFNVDKKTIVMKKQAGTDSDDLWIAYGVAAKSSVSPEMLLQSRQKYGTWQETLAAHRIAAQNLGAHLSTALNARVSTSRLAEAVVDDLFITHRLLGATELAEMRRADAANQELIIATVIAAKNRQPAKKVYLEVKSGAKTWGYLLQAAHIDTRNMEREISGILK